MMHDLKKLFSLMLLTLMILSLAACAGEAEPLVDKDANISVCHANVYTADGSQVILTSLRDEAARELYEYFATSAYVSMIGAVADSVPYITATFEKATESGEYDGVIEFAVYSNDKVELNDEIIGRLDGAFELLATSIFENKNDVALASQCSLVENDPEGKELWRENIIGRLSREVFNELESGTYVENPERIENYQAYYSVSFSPQGEFDIESGDLYDYRIYENDYVMRKNLFSEVGYVGLGYLDGAYKMLRGTVDEEKAIKKAESEAGFEFNTLIVKTPKSVEWDYSDLSDINCVSVGKAMDEDNYVWWSVIIESESKETTLEAERWLEARGDVVMVSLNYLMKIE